MYNYTIYKDDLVENIKEDVSHVADKAYGDDGASLYDSIIILDRHSDKLDRLIEDAIQTVLTTFFDCAKRNGSQILFDLPDMVSTNEEQAGSRITRFIASRVVADWLSEYYTEAKDEYVQQASEALAGAVDALRQRAQTRRTQQL